MAESSFDVEAGVEQQEVDNAINQAAREVATRFDFKDTDRCRRTSPSSS
jgi:uncharacterized protein YajQ (UPF0234 family)